jgi:hypothetical protein
VWQTRYSLSEAMSGMAQIDRKSSVAGPGSNPTKHDFTNYLNFFWKMNPTKHFMNIGKPNLAYSTTILHKIGSK